MYGYDHLARPPKIVPLTAVGLPEHSKDFRDWTVRIKPGIFFAEDPAFKGKPRELVAEDYVYAFKRFADPANKSAVWSYLEEFGIVGLQAQRLLAETGDQGAGPREQQVAGDDRDRVAPHRLGARHPSTHLRLVHDVVVIERGEMGDLQRRRRADDLVGRAVAELSGEQHEHGTHPLAAGFEQVAGRGVGEIVGEPHLAQQHLLDALEPGLDVIGELALVA